jgi:hypothetical protein
VKVSRPYLHTAGTSVFRSSSLQVPGHAILPAIFLISLQRTQVPLPCETPFLLLEVTFFELKLVMRKEERQVSVGFIETLLLV